MCPHPGSNEKINDETRLYESRAMCIANSEITQLAKKKKCKNRKHSIVYFSTKPKSNKPQHYGNTGRGLKCKLHDDRNDRSTRRVIIKVRLYMIVDHSLGRRL